MVDYIHEQRGMALRVRRSLVSAYTEAGGLRSSSHRYSFNATCLPQQSPSSEPTETAESLTNGSATNVNGVEQPTQEDNSTERAVEPSDVDLLVQQAYTLCPIEITAPKYRYAHSPQNSSAYLGGRDIQFYALGDDRKTGVIFVSTLAPLDPSTNAPSVPCTNRFVADLYLGFKNFTAAGVERILIDTSNNGGGQVVLNQFLQRYITGERHEVDLNFDTLLRNSPLAEGLLKANIEHASHYTIGNTYFPSKYRDGTERVTANTDFFSPGNSYTINGEILHTSNTLQDSIETIDQFEEPLNIPHAPTYSPADIVFTGNGLCGSACSSFTNFLIEYYNATAYIASARPQNPIEFQAFAAGQATTSDAIYEEAASINYTDRAMLPPLEVSGKFGFTIRGAISPNIAPGTFLQYRSYPAQKTYGLTAEHFLDPLANWKYVASQVFG